jgi:pyruvate dehydrogenase E2 component (dihydrolipoamide acetyltransferase)
MPEVAEDPTEGILTEWLVGESGAFVCAQSIATVETEKLLVSVEVSEPGVLIKALVPAGAHVDPGTALAVLADLGEQVGDLEALLIHLGLAQAPHVEPFTPLYAPPYAPPAEFVETTAVAPSFPRRPAAERRRISTPHESRAEAPRTRTVADLLGLTVTRPAAPPPAPAVQESEPDAEPDPQPIVPAAAASTYVASVAQLHLRETVHAERLMAVLAEVNDDSERISVTDLVVKAVAATFSRVPLGEAGPAIDVAVAVPTDPGVATALVRDVGALTVTAVAEARTALATRAGEDRLTPDELEGGAVTVVDLGAYGVAEVTVDVTPLRRMVLAVGAVRAEPVVVADTVVAGKVITVTLSIDQQVADAVLAARWMRALVSLLEHPVRFLA